MENSNKALTPPPLIGKKKKKLKKIYAPRNEFCMIWVIFLMPTDHVMALLCFITDSQLVDMSGQVICVRPGRWWWVIIEKNILLLFSCFGPFGVLFCLFFSNGKFGLTDPSPPHPNGIFHYFFFEPFPRGSMGPFVLLGAFFLNSLVLMLQKGFWHRHKGWFR